MRRHRLAILAVLLLALVLAMTAGDRAAYTAIAFPTRPGSQQGIATDGRYTWVSSDAGGGMARIATYTRSGSYIGTSAKLPIGHAAAIAYRVADGRLYAANGGLTTERTSADTRIYAVALDRRHIATGVTATYDFGWLGRNGLVAIDNQTDAMVVMGGPDGGPWRIAVARFPVARRTSPPLMSEVVPIRDPHAVLQGLGAASGRLYVYVSDGTTRVSRLDVFTTSGIQIAKDVLPFTGEAEGLAIDPRTGSISVGTHAPNRVLRLDPRTPAPLP
ncbi:MAG: hypothetical protein HIU86_01320 [Acidobacteria bacterium]|nr:hypothetical protein [Acidobacteriota bacterium]